MPEASVERGAGRVLGRRYELAERIGGGASAEVFRAIDRNLARNVAIKQLRSHLSEDERFVKLFRTEAHLVAQLDHPNVVTVFDWNADEDLQDGGAFIVTELLTGGTLRDWLKAEGTLSVADVAFVGLQVAQGLNAAHQAGLVHRDIKPANLLFGGEGRVRIADFGIARAVAEAAWTEPEGRLIGTARYAAPEQATTGAVDGLADVYSLAVCLVEAVTGSVPLIGDNALGTMLLRKEQDLPVDPALGPLQESLTAAGRRDPAQRISSLQLRDALLDVCRSLPDFSWMTDIDLTEFGGMNSGTAEAPNVRFGQNGDLIIEGEDESDLALPPVTDLPSVANTDLMDTPSNEGLFAPSGPSNSQTIPTGTPTRRRGRGRLLAGIGVALLAVLGAAGYFGYQYYLDSIPETEVIAVGLPSYPVGDYAMASVEEVEAEAETNGWAFSMTETFDDDTVAGELLAQAPEPGTMLPPGGAVSLELSRGPRPRTVPEMVGFPEDEVTARIAAADLTLGEVTTEHDEEVEVGVVLSATVDGVPVETGQQFPPGTAVDLVLSSGPRPRVVPVVVGLTVEAATAALEAEDLAIAVGEDYSETVAEGLIISANPAASNEVPRGSTVRVTVSLGLPFVTVPDVSGKPVAEANSELEALGFRVTLNGVLNSTVLGTRPGAGTSLRLGSEVELLSVD